jgi:hypothetical protein
MCCRSIATTHALRASWWLQPRRWMRDDRRPRSRQETPFLQATGLDAGELLASVAAGKHAAKLFDPRNAGTTPANMRAAVFRPRAADCFAAPGRAVWASP